MSTLYGTAFIGSHRGEKNGSTFSAFNPATGEALAPNFSETSFTEIDQACACAEEAFRHFALTSGKTRARLLREIALEIEDLGDALIELYTKETALPVQRAIGERARTCAQLRAFAEIADKSLWVEARIDHAQPERKPQPRADIRSMLRPIGPIAVFGPANFPLAFSVAGGDTASALAAGCPVIVKAHPAHPGTSELVGGALARAVRTCELPGGVFSLIFGATAAVGAALVKHRAIKAVAFTGAKTTGLALVKIISERDEPIPLFGELSSLNPVFILPGAMRMRAASIAREFHASLTLGIGQFCTNPGIVIFQRDAQVSLFKETLLPLVEETPAGAMLSRGIQKNYKDLLAGLDVSSTVQRVMRHHQPGPLVLPAIYETSAKTFLQHQELAEEIFGPASILVECESENEMRAVAEIFRGQLTATFYHADESEINSECSRALISTMLSRAGRIIFNQFPTGVEVCPAMVHGGPWPATTDSRFTSVGSPAIRRWARPACWQSAPESVLPPEVRDTNPLRIAREVNGALEFFAS